MQFSCLNSCQKSYLKNMSHLNSVLNPIMPAALLLVVHAQHRLCAALAATSQIQTPILPNQLQLPLSKNEQCTLYPKQFLVVFSWLNKYQTI